MNTFLKRARLQARLTQEELARALGTTPVSIWRWEDGRLPTPFYRRAICDYFNLTPAELGWPSNMRHQKSRNASMPSLVDPAIPVQGNILTGQRTLLAHLRTMLCAANGPPHVSLTGVIGSGKTAVAQQLSTLPQIRETFAGILWASLGPEIQPLLHFQRWAELLGLDTCPASLSAAQAKLHQIIGQRRILFVLDDVWTSTDIIPFQIGGRACQYLVTTRQPALARLLSPQQILQVEDLTDEEAFTLLVADFPVTVVQEYTANLQMLIKSVGKLPLALVLMHEYLCREALMQPPRRFREAILRLAHRGVSPGTLDFLRMETSWHSRTLFAAIQQSETLLYTSARKALRLFASRFQETAFTESEAAALVLQGQVQQELDNLVDVGLLAWSEQGYSLHPIIVEYARMTDLEPPQERELPETRLPIERAYPGRSQPLLN